MSKTASVLLRWVAACCLYLIVGVLFVPTLAAQLVSGAGLSVIEPLKARADRLIGR